MVCLAEAIAEGEDHFLRTAEIVDGRTAVADLRDGAGQIDAAADRRAARSRLGVTFQVKRWKPFRATPGEVAKYQQVLTAGTVVQPDVALHALGQGVFHEG